MLADYIQLTTTIQGRVNKIIVLNDQNRWGTLTLRELRFTFEKLFVY